jgi:DNA recombination protein Rad52
MAFSQTQIRKLAGKLPERFVKTRNQRGLTLSYIEGWHVIDEANRVFGFDGWDRETIWSECVWQDGRQDLRACTYCARVRIRVRAGKTLVSREGSGVGHGTGTTLGEAHESALKEAETDATKRALTTFGNLFGLALYDKDQGGVARTNTAHATQNDGAAPNAGAAPVIWTLFSNTGAPLQKFADPQGYCSAAKEALLNSGGLGDLEAFWKVNQSSIAQLRSVWPALKTRHGVHYADVLERLYRQQVLRWEHEDKTRARHEAGGIDKSVLALPAPKRIRDDRHLKYIASLPCLVCGRTPSQAHHLRFAQSRAMGKKVSDEWVVPLCTIHHRALHDVGSEETWWQEHHIDALVEAERLWRVTHPSVDSVASDPRKITQPPVMPGNDTAELPSASVRLDGSNGGGRDA